MKLGAHTSTDKFGENTVNSSLGGFYPMFISFNLKNERARRNKMLLEFCNMKISSFTSFFGALVPAFYMYYYFLC